MNGLDKKSLEEVIAKLNECIDELRATVQLREKELSEQYSIAHELRYQIEELTGKLGLMEAENQNVN